MWVHTRGMLGTEPRAICFCNSPSHCVTSPGQTLLKLCPSAALSISIFMSGSERSLLLQRHTLWSICKHNTQVLGFHFVSLGDLQTRLLGRRPLEVFWWGHICYLYVPPPPTSPISRVLHSFGIPSLSLLPRIRDSLTGAEAWTLRPCHVAVCIFMLLVTLNKILAQKENCPVFPCIPQTEDRLFGNYFV